MGMRLGLGLWHRWGGVESSGGFTPADLFASSETGGAWDPANTTTLWQDTSATTPVTASGQSVARMDDISGNGKHWLQSDASRRPTYTESGSLKYLSFAQGSGDDYMTITAPGFKFFDSSHFFAVQVQSALSTNGGLLSWRGSSSDWNSGDGIVWEIGSSNNQFLVYHNTAQINLGSTIGTPPWAAPHYFHTLLGGGSREARLYKDGTLVGTDLSIAGSGQATMPNDAALGMRQLPSIQRSTGFYYFGHCDIDRQISGDELTSMNAFYASRIGA